MGYLVPVVPIYLLDFKFGHFGNPLVFYSKRIYFSPLLLVTNARLSDLVPRIMEVAVYYKKQARATEDYTGLIGVTLKKSMFFQTS
jgi:hypothetical protein